MEIMVTQECVASWQTSPISNMFPYVAAIFVEDLLLA